MAELELDWEQVDEWTCSAKSGEYELTVTRLPFAKSWTWRVYRRGSFVPLGRASRGTATMYFAAEEAESKLRELRGEE